jgi:hypothetical protein
MEPGNWFQRMNFASLCSQAGRYDNPVPTRFLASIDCLKIPALIHLFNWEVKDDLPFTPFRFSFGAKYSTRIIIIIILCIITVTVSLLYSAWQPKILSLAAMGRGGGQEWEGIITNRLVIPTILRTLDSWPLPCLAGLPWGQLLVPQQ